MIPKIIHYCWLSNDPIPQNLQNCMKSWKEKLPDYEFILWNFERFDINSSLWVKQAFENKKYAFAADYIRLYSVYNYGGIYMDMDIEVLKSFNDLLDKPLMLAYENDKKIGIEAGCFGAERHNPTIKNCLDYYTDRSFIKQNGEFDTLTCPHIMAKFCNKENSVDIYDKFFFTCKSYKTGIIATRNYSYAIHHFAGSWQEDWRHQVQVFSHSYIQKHGNSIVSRFVVTVYHISAIFRHLGIMQGGKFLLKKIRKK